MSAYTSRIRSKKSKANGKCGEITFCLQVRNRVYALNCIFCSQIFLEWDIFINHMEEEHDEELRGNYLLQQENSEEVLPPTYKPKENPTKVDGNIYASASKSNSLLGINEYDDNVSATADPDDSDPLVILGSSDNFPPTVPIKAETFDFDNCLPEVERTDEQAELDAEFLSRYNETTTRLCPEQIENHEYESNNKTFPMAVSTDVVVSEINLNEILNCFKGQSVQSYYKANNCLDPKNRRVLCDLIIDKIFDRGWKMRSRDIPFIAEKIIQIFPSEDRLCEGSYDNFEIATQSSSSSVGEDVRNGDADKRDEPMYRDKSKLTAIIIQCFKEHSVLWDTTKSGHRNNLKHHEAYETITQEVNARLGTDMKCLDIKIEIEKLKSKFRKECKLLTDFEPNLDGSTEIDGCDGLLAKSRKSWIYEKLIFLKDHIGCDGRKRGKRGTKSLANNRLYLPLTKHSAEDNLLLIELYKTYPCLWDVNHIDYRFKDRRLECLREMLDAVNTQMNLNLCLDDLQKKLYYIRYSFTQEKHRQIESEKLNRPHKPQCKLYAELTFLKDSVGPFKCEYCEEIFNGPDQYKMHKSTHDGLMPYNCPICHKGFMKVGNCTVHLRRHTKDYQFDCKECDKRFATSTDLNVHIRQHTGEKPYFCDVCGQSFRTWTYFDTHMKRHQKNPSHQCSICLKAFYEKNKLKDHMKSHLNIRDKVCNVCGKSFTCSKYLSQHKQIHSDKKLYCCKICGKTFAQYGGLSGHMKSHGKAFPISDNENSVSE